MKSVFVVNGLFAQVEEDNYEQGCLPDTGFCKDVDITFKAGSIHALIGQVCGFLGCDDCLVNPCEDEPSRIDWQVMEDGDGLPADGQDIENWKAGNKKLYLVNYTGIVEESTEVDVEKALQSIQK